MIIVNGKIENARLDDNGKNCNMSCVYTYSERDDRYYCYDGEPLGECDRELPIAHKKCRDAAKELRDESTLQK